MKKIVSIILIAFLALSLAACQSKSSEAFQTEDLKELTIGAELPYLLYASNEYCIIDMWHGGVIVYDFTAQEISDRVTYEALKAVGFSYPNPTVSKDGKTLYFSEDALFSDEPNTHSYNLDKRKLRRKNDSPEYTFQPKDIYENNELQAVLSDGPAYGSTYIELDDEYILSRQKKDSWLLSDTEIIIVDKSLNSQKAFALLN